MPYLIDSDLVIDHLADVPEAVMLLRRLAGDGIAISVVTYMEVYQGVLMSPQPEDAERQLRAFVDGIPVIPFDMRVAERCVAIRAELRRYGRRIGARALDLIIAATAIEHQLTLVTRNTDDYRDITGLGLYQPS